MSDRDRQLVAVHDSDPSLARLADLVVSLRPQWPMQEVRTALWQARKPNRTLGQLCHVAITAALSDTADRPSFMLNAAAWEAPHEQPASGPPVPLKYTDLQSAERCKHGELPGACALCRYQLQEPDEGTIKPEGWTGR